MEKYKWIQNVACRTIEGETVIIGASQQEVHLLDDVATFLWQHLEQGATVPQLVEQLTAQYEVAHSVAEQDIREFLDTLIEKELVQML